MNGKRVMVFLIEEQIHKKLIEQEEARSESENELRRAQGKKPKKPRVVPKPWSRPRHDSLCQETELLLLVDRYDYDLSDKDFQNYCARRGVLHMAGVDGSERWRYFLDFDMSESDFKSNPYFGSAIEVDGKRLTYSAEEMKVLWKTIQIGRARLQDCWELYLQRRAR